MKKEIKDVTAYEVIIDKQIEEVNSRCLLLKHKKTGARVVLLSNDDDNKVFQIGFRTPVKDDTGVPHIIEHTVLCGSEKFPVKDPFMELVKGSLNTFLNAMTYPDKTVYPIASYNMQDFKNLMHIYMDAVLKPNIYQEEKIFQQEGWHYELEDKDANLIYNGIVYNEMKGVYSSVDGINDRVTLQSLFPDNGYGCESGGDPDFIPELSYEKYLEFHQKYYHPSNSYIYLYGDMDMVERLEWMDQEYLGNYDALPIDSHIPYQKPFSEAREIEREYAISDGEQEKENAVLSANYVIGDNLDAKLSIAFQIIEYALMEMPGAPLKQALIRAGIGKDVYGQYETDVLQPVYSIIAKYTDIEEKEKFIRLINDTLTHIVSEGIDKDALLAGLNSLEFKTREADFGRYPKGLMWGLEIMSSWLYSDSQPFIHLETNGIFEELREKINTDYFEQLIKKYLLENTHCSVVVLKPKKGLTEEKEKQLAEKLAQKKASMTEKELEKLVRETAELKAFQEQPSTAEELSVIPLLKISDINPEPRPSIRQEETVDYTVMLYNGLFTNGIGYLDFVFDCSDLPQKYHPYIGLLKYLLAFMDTDRSYAKLNTDIDLNLGGLAFDTALYQNQKTDKIVFNMEIHTKMMDTKMEKAFSLVEEIICKTTFEDTKRLKEILEELKSRLNTSIMQSGDSAARLRAMSYYSKAYYIREQIAGISFYKFVEEILDSFEQRKQELVAMLSETIKKVFRKDRMLLNYAGSKESYEEGKRRFLQLKNKMYEDTAVYQEQFDGWEFVPCQKNEGFETPGQVQYVARVGNYNPPGKKIPFDGSLLVLGNIMRSEYLWNNIRVLGGAYGCNCLVGRGGDVFFTSYRDPNLKKTSDVYLNAADYIENFTADEREMRKFIIGTISNLDTPLGAYDQSIRELGNYFAGIDNTILKKEREKVLHTTEKDIRNLAPLIKTVLDKNNICVVGSKSAVQGARELFRETKELG